MLFFPIGNKNGARVKLNISQILAMPSWITALISLFLIGNIVAMFSVGVHPDEAYYWVWSENLHAGYFDHPPLVAWVIRLFTSIFGDHAWVIRLPALLAWSTIGVSVYLIARDAFPEKRHAGALAALVATSLPLYQVGSHIITPDSPYLTFTALSFLALFWALTRDPRWWLAVGLFGGLSLLSKYIAVLFPAAIFIALLLSKSGRQHFLTPWPWLAVVIAGIVFSPVVYWNAQHDWISFLFQLGHGVNLDSDASAMNVLLYMGSQLAMTMPWVFIAMIVASVNSRTVLAGNKSVYGMLVIGFGLPLVFFALTGFTMISGAHWPAAAYIPASVLLGGMLAQWLVVSGADATRSNDQQRRWLVVTVIVAGLLSMMLANVIRYRGNTQLANTFGWPEVGLAVKEIYDRQPAAGTCVIGSQYWGLSAAIAFALNKPHGVLVLPGGRAGQYEIWREEIGSTKNSDFCVFVEMSDHDGNFPDKKVTRDEMLWRLERVHESPSAVRSRWFGIYVRAPKRGLR